MKKASVYTRTGDLGLTGLVGGTRIKKSDDRIHLYGEVDELNSVIGIGISHLDEKFDKTMLLKIQSSLFDIGSNLACEKENREKFKLPQITDECILELEADIDRMDEKLKPLTHFVLPGGSVEASFFHLARTVCRRVERQMVHFSDLHTDEIPHNVLKFINRLSDYFFILSRFLNANKNIAEISWIPKK